MTGLHVLSATHACRVLRSPLSLASAALMLASPSFAQGVVDFPMDVANRLGAMGSFEYTPRPAEFQAVLDQQKLQMVGVELPNGTAVALDLVRIDFDFAKLGVHVDGKEMAGWDPGDLSLWKGSVLEDEFSHVILGLSSAGCYGWIATEGETWHIAAFAGPGGDWSAPGVRMWAESIADMARDPNERKLCLSEGIERNMRVVANQQTAAAGSSVRGSLSECKVAIETDFQLFQLFGSLTAEQNYIAQLLAAISDRYETEVDVVLTYPYLMFHTNQNDGWTTADTGGDTGDMLTEFRTAWAGNIPAGGHLAHFLSGASLGGGIAYLDVLCNPNFGFGVSANFGAAVTFPVQQGSGNWDFYVTCHELGHNFSSPHTHNYCPPLDLCAPSSVFGQCQTSRQCSNQGTIMSYCHLCSGGVNNITTYFHPTVVAQIRSAVANSCLPPYDDGGGGCLDDSAEPNDTCSTATVIGQGLSTGYQAKDDNLDNFKITVPGGASLTIDVLFSHAAGDVDASLEDDICFAVLDTAMSSSDNEQLTWQNPDTFARDVTLVVYNSAQSDCFAYDIDVDIETDPCDSFGDDSLEDNDTCGTARSMGQGTFLGLGVKATDPDFYEIEVDAGATLSVDALFQHADADIDIYLYDPQISCGDNSNYLERGFTSSDNENVTWTNSSFGTKTYILEVQVYTDSAGQCSNYILGIDPGVGTGVGVNYCGPAVINSTGVPGKITAQGSNSVAANDLTLIASDCPPTSLGYFLVSSISGFVQNPAGSNGNLCLLPPFGRFLQFAGPVAPDGTRMLDVDLTMIPQPTTIVSIQPGETWYFQFWHRDSLLGFPTNNFTDGVGVQFQ